MIRIAVLIMLSCLPCARSFGGEAPAASVLVVAGLKEDKGQLRIGVFADAASWLGPAPRFSRVLPVKREADGTMRVELPADLPARVAVAVVHDLDGSGEMNRNAVGMPTEPYGFSNNHRPRFGPPSFQAALVDPRAAGGPRVEVR